jgi:hypothetical protein
VLCDGSLYQGLFRNSLIPLLNEETKKTVKKCFLGHTVGAARRENGMRWWRSRSARLCPVVVGSSFLMSPPLGGPFSVWAPHTNKTCHLPPPGPTTTTTAGLDQSRIHPIWWSYRAAESRRASSRTSCTHAAVPRPPRVEYCASTRSRVRIGAAP